MKFENSPKIERIISSDDYKEIIETPEFKKWFSGSVVVDKKGDPLTAYHSTNIKNFQGQELKRNELATDWNSFGIYFSSDKEATRGFFESDYTDSKDRYEKLLKTASGEEKFIIKKDQKDFLNKYEPVIKTFSCFLKIEKPLVLDNHQQLMELSYSGVTYEMLKEKYDGIIVTHDSEFTDQYIVFNSDQIYMSPSLIG